MPFVKVDCGILNSTLWFDKDARDVFLTALLMAEPYGTLEQKETYDIETGGAAEFAVPPGWYGFVHAAGTAIIRYSMSDETTGMEALKRLAEPDSSSRTPDFEGRRMVRINGGFLILNYQKYRDRDYTAAERSARYRERKRNAVTSTSHTVSSRDITQAEGEAEAEGKSKYIRRAFVKPTMEELAAYLNGRDSTVDPVAFMAHYDANGWMIGKNHMKNWKAATWTWERGRK